MTPEQGDSDYPRVTRRAPLSPRLFRLPPAPYRLSEAEVNELCFYRKRNEVVEIAIPLHTDGGTAPCFMNSRLIIMVKYHGLGQMNIYFRD
jgi:hypothetical protein